MREINVGGRYVYSSDLPRYIYFFLPALSSPLSIASPQPARSAAQTAETSLYPLSPSTSGDTQSYKPEESLDLEQ